MNGGKSQWKQTLGWLSDRLCPLWVLPLCPLDSSLVYQLSGWPVFYVFPDGGPHEWIGTGNDPFFFSLAGNAACSRNDLTRWLRAWAGMGQCRLLLFCAHSLPFPQRGHIISWRLGHASVLHSRSCRPNRGSDTESPCLRRWPTLRTQTPDWSRTKGGWPLSRHRRSRARDPFGRSG